MHIGNAIKLNRTDLTWLRDLRGYNESLFSFNRGVTERFSRSLHACLQLPAFSYNAE